MPNLNQIVTTIESVLIQESSHQIKSRSDIALAKIRRDEISNQISEMNRVVNELRTRYNNLPALPETEFMDWAEAILDMPNLAILVLDTTGTHETADIIRVYASNQSELLIDQIVKPGRELTPNTAYTGINQEQIDGAPTIQEAWPAIQKALRGHYIVSFNLDWVEARLKNNIAHYGLDRLPLRGECLMEQAKSYFGLGDYSRGTRLPDLCARIGHPFPYHPPLATDRAKGCLLLLQAMVQGVTSIPAATAAKGDVEEMKESSPDPLDDHPF